MERMEKMFSYWIEHHNQHMPLAGAAIQAKAKSLYADLSKEEEDPVPFTASSGWFDRFKHCFGSHNIKLTREAAAADHVAAEEFKETFKLIVEEGGYMPKQI